MTKFKRKLLVSLLAVLALGLMGCAESVSNLRGLSELPDDGFGIDLPREDFPTSPEGSIGGFNTGATAELVPESVSRMSQYAMRDLSNPTNIKVNVTLDDFGGGAIGGYVKIAYDDNGRRVVGTFSAGEHKQDAKFNRWFNASGEEVFHGFFEDNFGAIVLVVDEVLDLGDGGSFNQVNGSIWFKNHRITADTGPNPSNSCLPGLGCPNTRCWFVKDGPYECRAFVINDEIFTTSRVYPDNGYKKLGSFFGLDRAIAFAE